MSERVKLGLRSLPTPRPLRPPNPRAQTNFSPSFGGNTGTTAKVRTGDVIVVPAGAGHECLSADKSFLVVGISPSGPYSECRGSFQEYAKAREQVRHVPKPEKNPLFGGRRPLW
jgi:uncharacterized protein YjlB